MGGPLPGRPAHRSPSGEIGGRAGIARRTMERRLLRRTARAGARRMRGAPLVQLLKDERRVGDRCLPSVVRQRRLLPVRAAGARTVHPLHRCAHAFSGQESFGYDCHRSNPSAPSTDARRCRESEARVPCVTGIPVVATRGARLRVAVVRGRVHRERSAGGRRKRNSPLARAVVVRSGKARVAGGAGGSRTHLDGFAIRCITALLPRRCREPSGRKREADASLLVDTVEAAQRLHSDG